MDINNVVTLKYLKVLVLTAERQSGFLRRRRGFAFRCFLPAGDLCVLLTSLLLLEKRNNEEIESLLILEGDIIFKQPAPLIKNRKHRHLEEGNTFALVEDEVLVDEGRLCGQAFIAGTQLLLQRVLHQMEVTKRQKLTFHSVHKVTLQNVSFPGSSQNLSLRIRHTSPMCRSLIVRVFWA